jgi:hypothetical protein
VRLSIGNSESPSRKRDGFGAHRTALQDSRRHGGYSIPGLASTFRAVLRATPSDAEDDVRKSKAPPARGLISVRCRSQERFRTWVSRSGLPRIQTTFQDEPAKEGGIQIPLDPRSVRELVIPLLQRLLGLGPVHVVGTGVWLVENSSNASLAALNLLRMMLTNIPGARTLQLLPNIFWNAR